MNIWALKKDIAIKHLLLLLQDVFKPGAYEIIDTDADDARSVRLCNNAITPTVIYIYTFGQRQDHYGVHIEYPNIQETSYYDTLDVYENISFDRLVELIKMKLDVDPGLIQPAT